DREHEAKHGRSAGAVRMTAALIVDKGHSCDRFHYPVTDAAGRDLRVEWTNDAARAVCIAFALHCPDIELEMLAWEAEEELENFASGFYDDEDDAQEASVQ